MIPAWLKRFVNSQRTKKLHHRGYPRLRPPPVELLKINNVSYGKTYGYAYTASTNGHKHGNTNRSTSRNVIRPTIRAGHHYYLDDYDGGYGAPADVGGMCGGGNWSVDNNSGNGDSSYNGGDVDCYASSCDGVGGSASSCCGAGASSCGST